MVTMFDKSSQSTLNHLLISISSRTHSEEAYSTVGLTSDIYASSFVDDYAILRFRRI